MMKVKMKIAGAFRTFKGAVDFAALRPVVATARKQGWKYPPDPDRQPLHPHPQPRRVTQPGQLPKNMFLFSQAKRLARRLH
jgi:hypothetical protein